MEIENLYFDEVTLDEEKNNVIIKSTTIKFPEPAWVSVHDNKDGEKYGPFTLLQDKNRFSKDIIIKDLGERVTKFVSKKPYHIQYKEKWTASPRSIFAIVIPENFVFLKLDITDEQGTKIEIDNEITNSCRLLYYIVIGEQLPLYILNINGVLKEDKKEFDIIKNGTKGKWRSFKELLGKHSELISKILDQCFEKGIDKI